MGAVKFGSLNPYRVGKTLFLFRVFCLEIRRLETDPTSFYGST